MNSYMNRKVHMNRIVHMNTSTRFHRKDQSVAMFFLQLKG